MSKRQNGYVFHLGDENILYEPTGDIRGLLGYSKAFKDQPINSAIVPALSYVLKSNKDELVPAKIEDILKNRKYNQMVDLILRFAPSLQTIYVNSSIVRA